MMLHVVDEIAALPWGAGGTIQTRVEVENECMHYVCWMPAYVLPKKTS
jgi:hypothetical protein